jgi:hypothetical protein
MNTEPKQTERMPFEPKGDTKEVRALHALCSTPNRAGRRALDKVQGGAPHRGACARWTPRNPVRQSVHAPGYDVVVLIAGNAARNAAKRERRARRGVS